VHNNILPVKRVYPVIIEISYFLLLFQIRKMNSVIKRIGGGFGEDKFNA
tara:strand:+ start:60 stop:206 length:147 start_codon:yes stop_codon:yes gene_type:complete